MFIDYPVVHIISASETEMRVSGSVFRQLQVAWNNGEENNKDNSFWWVLLWSYPKDAGTLRTLGDASSEKWCLIRMLKDGRIYLEGRGRGRKAAQAQERASVPQSSCQCILGFSFLLVICSRQQPHSHSWPPLSSVPHSQWVMSHVVHPFHLLKACCTYFFLFCHLRT